ncbi:MAG: dihydroneopterin triphosphate diphosphatase [Betaproteobacteria bacterium]|nr:dihydroneopterin triphosphate diphosphatase [Betaproteobacteria bacterium]
MAKRPESVLVIIYTSSLDVLLLERADHPGWWQSVTGSLEPGEPPLHAAIRETSEETGLDARRWRLTDEQTTNHYEIYDCFRHRYAPGVTHNTEHVFSLQLPEREQIVLAPREHLRYIWLPAEQAAQQCFSPTNQAAIQQLTTKNP